MPTASYFASASSFSWNNGATNGQRGATFIATGFHFHGLHKGTRTPCGIECDLDFCRFARFDGLGGKFGTSAATRSHHLHNHQRLVASVFKFKRMLHRPFSLLDVAKVVFLYLIGGVALRKSRKANKGSHHHSENLLHSTKKNI